jgi:hypothetical protein
MNADTLFQIASTTALAGWASLLIRPLVPRFSDLVASFVIPLLLAVAYTGLVMAYWTSGKGGFDTLDNVALLFQTRELLLAGWIHYLAFDLFVGAWIARAAQAAKVPFWLVVPCLALTFLFGPAGLLAFLALRAAMRPGQAFVAA